MSRRDCESIRPLISAFFDGDLPASESGRLHQHLAVCQDCREIVDEYQRIRSDFRDLPPTPAPPEHLANRVWAETVERPKPTGVRRIFSATSAKVGLSTVGALAILAVICAFVLVRGYSHGITPTVVGSTPLSAQSWPVYQPVKIEFNKQMNHVSVEQNLQIWPPGERTRIPTSWDGNTLILGANSAQSTVFLPDTTYQIMVLGSAQDAFGHQLGKTWSMSFRTSPVSTTAQSETPTPNTAAVNRPTPEPTQGSAVISGSPSPTPTTSVPNRGGDQNATQPTDAAPPIQPTADSATEPVVVETPTVVSSPTSVATPAPTQTVKPTATPPTATPAPPATPTSVPVTPQPTVVDATPTQPSVGTPTATVVPVTGAFGSVYWANTDVQSKLGAASGPEVVINASELGFQRGTMYERFDTGEIYVFFANDQWNKVKDTWNPSDGEGGGPGPDAGLWIPKERFWKVWNSDPNLTNAIGYAVEQDPHLMTKSGGSFQTFAHGIMLYSDQGFVYVVYNDGSWALYPDTSGHGDLITPTPEPATPEATSPPATPASTATSTDVAPASSSATPESTATATP